MIGLMFQKNLFGCCVRCSHRGWQKPAKHPGSLCQCQVVLDLTKPRVQPESWLTNMLYYSMPCLTPQWTPISLPARSMPSCDLNTSYSPQPHWTNKEEVTRHALTSNCLHVPSAATLFSQLFLLLFRSSQNVTPRKRPYLVPNHILPCQQISIFSHLIVF